jgi:hypothetical protein
MQGLDERPYQDWATGTDTDASCGPAGDRDTSGSPTGDAQEGCAGHRPRILTDGGQTDSGGDPGGGGREWELYGGRVTVELGRSNGIWIKTNAGRKHLCEDELKRIAEDDAVGETVLLGESPEEGSA